jgi:ketosteroid isomerase-like protein
MQTLGQHVSVARALVEGFEARDEERLLALFSPDVRFWTRVQVLEDRHFEGLDGVRAWLRAVDEKWDRYEIRDACYCTGEGGQVLVSGRLSLRYRGDTYAQSRAVQWVLTMDDRSRIVSFRSFRDADEARTAAGVND